VAIEVARSRGSRYTLAVTQTQPGWITDESIRWLSSFSHPVLRNPLATAAVFASAAGDPWTI
jgi:hypothetical protein